MNKSKNRVWLDHPPKGRVQVYYNLHKKCLSISDAEQILEFIKQSRNIRKINEITRSKYN